MLRVRAIKKFYDNEGKLLGYTIQNEDNPSEVMNVYKDKLKAAVKNGSCEVVNMTMTSDGRLIGRACKAPTPRKPRFTLEIKELYNIGKDIIGGEIVDVRTNQGGYFIGQEIDYMVEKGMIARTGEEKKKAFKSIYSKVLKAVEGQLQTPINLTVEKTGKDLYTIGSTSGWNTTANKSTVSLVVMCIIYAMKVSKTKVVNVDLASGSVTVNGLAGINDIRKAIKDAGLNKL